MSAAAEKDVAGLPSTRNSDVVHSEILFVNAAVFLFVFAWGHDALVGLKTEHDVELESLRLVVGDNVDFVRLSRPESARQQLGVFYGFPKRFDIPLAFALWLAEPRYGYGKTNIVSNLAFGQIKEFVNEGKAAMALRRSRIGPKVGIYESSAETHRVIVASQEVGKESRPSAQTSVERCRAESFVGHADAAAD